MTRRVVAFFLLCGCAPSIDRSQPPDLRLGEDSCDSCKMIINEARFAAAFYDQEQKPWRFDDLGCLVAALRPLARPYPLIWVHDYQGERWLLADEAIFVASANIHTAMGSGIVAVGSAEAADALVAEHAGAACPWEPLVARTDEP